VPRLVNPASGYLINANNTPFQAAGPGDELDPRAFSPLLGIETDFTNRGIRSIELLEADTSISEKSWSGSSTTPAFPVPAMPGPWLKAIAALDPGDDPDLREAQALMAGWDWTLDGRGRADAMAVLLMRLPIVSIIAGSRRRCA
jgi:acyl-homoserine-lactone acylase